MESLQQIGAILLVLGLLGYIRQNVPRNDRADVLLR